MKDYQSRLDRLEAIIAPTDAFHVVVVKDDETQQHALEVYAARRRLEVADIRSRAVFISEIETRL